MDLRLFNTLTREKEIFEPIDRGNVRMYVCGPTVYDYAHIGNARPVIVFDLLCRLLRHLYGPEHVTYVRNITDVDDKINARAAREGVSIRELTETTAAQFHADMAALGTLAPDVEPRATEHIDEMKAMIETLVAKGHAYVAEGHVLFHVPSMKDYGGLSKRTLEDMEAGARVEVAPYKKDPMDFVLWKPSKESEPGWPSPCGIAEPGRPGWHIECSAMSDRWLWQEAKARLSPEGLAHPHEFDIHGGGIDLTFPHHENEIAQSRCAHGSAVMAKYWMHNGFLQVEGEKMSKSLGNFITVHELLTGWKGKAWDGLTIRLAMLTTHYRQPIDFTEKGLAEAEKLLERWGRLIAPLAAASNETAEPPADLVEALCDDLNTPRALAVLHGLARDARGGDETAAAGLAAGLAFLGFDRDVLLAREAEAEAASADPQLAAMVEGLIAERLAARAAKNWAEADRIRDDLAARGVLLKDGKDPETGEIETTWELAR